MTCFEQMWADLAPIGRSASGGYRRQPWTPALGELEHWFLEQASARGLRVQADPLGNRIAWWQPGADAGPPGHVPDRVIGKVTGGVVTGSHLDSVLDGGAFDGPLGVVTAFAALDELRRRGMAPRRPIGVAAFVEEEGSRFGRACLGSQVMTGALPWAQARELRDRDGSFLPDVLAAHGAQPPRAQEPGPWDDLDGTIACFVELHVEQGRALADHDRAVGVASGIWPHGRWRFDVTGVADHAGTTRMEDRRDPMPTYAMTVLAAAAQARLSGQRATFGRVEVSPNGTNSIPARVTAWLDARASGEAELAELVDAVSREAARVAERDGTRVSVENESLSAQVVFDAVLASRLARATGDAPVLPTQAGHDAGVLQAAGIPTAMLFVRNPTGISHSPQEHASTADCLAGVQALADVLQELAS